MYSAFPKQVRVTSETARIMWRGCLSSQWELPKAGVCGHLRTSGWGMLWGLSVIGFLLHFSGQDKCWTSGVMWITKDSMSCYWQYYSLRWVSLLDWVSWQGFTLYEEVSGGKPSPADKIGWLWTASRNEMEIFAWSRSCLPQIWRAWTLSHWDGSDQQSLGIACGSKVTCVNMKVAK